MIESAAELARAIYDRQRHGRGSRDRPMPAWNDLELQDRRDRIASAKRLQSAYYRVDAREVPLTHDSPAR